jgi:hypothetical protein
MVLGNIGSANWSFRQVEVSKAKWFDSRYFALACCLSMIFSDLASLDHALARQVLMR